MFNVSEMMSQLQKTQAQMQEQMKKQAETLARTEVMGQSGGGLDLAGMGLPPGMKLPF